VAGELDGDRCGSPLQRSRPGHHPPSRRSHRRRARSAPQAGASLPQARPSPRQRAPEPVAPRKLPSSPSQPPGCHLPVASCHGRATPVDGRGGGPRQTSQDLRGDRRPGANAATPRSLEPPRWWCCPSKGGTRPSPSAARSSGRRQRGLQARSEARDAAGHHRRGQRRYMHPTPPPARRPEHPDRRIAGGQGPAPSGAGGR